MRRVALGPHVEEVQVAFRTELAKNGLKSAYPVGLALSPLMGLALSIRAPVKRRPARPDTPYTRPAVIFML